MSPNTPRENHVLLICGGLFITSWVSFQLMVRSFWPSARLSLVAFIASVALVTWMVSRNFAKSFRRPMTNAEHWKLIGYCAFWVVAQELMVLLSYFRDPPAERSLGVSGILFVVLVSTVAYLFILWLGIARISRVLVAAKLNKRTP